MKSARKNILAGIILLIVLTYCSEDKINPGIDNSAPGTEVANQESWNSQMIFYGTNGKLSAILYADYMVDYAARRVKYLRKMKVNFYDSLQNISTSLVADSGKVDDIVMKFFAVGNVVAVNDSGTVLKTEELVWRRRDEKIVTDKFVTVTSKKEDLQGYGFESDQHIRNWTVFKPVINLIVNQDKKKK